MIPIALRSPSLPRTRSRGPGLGLAFTLALAACAAPAPEPEAADEGWSVTAWGERFEVFPEVDPLVAGRTAVAHTHVTRLDGFEPLETGKVEIVLRGDAGEQVFAAEEPVRPGIFNVEITPDRDGERELLFRIRDDGGAEEIAAGRVRIGDGSSPGGFVAGPGTDGEDGTALPFLKEQQWRTEFATTWVRRGSLPGNVAGLATVRPAAGGEATVAATVDGVVGAAGGARSWPFVGLEVERGQALFRLRPLVAPDRSLPQLETDLATLESELGAAGERLARLEELLALEAASRREVDEARLTVRTLTARRSAAAHDLAAARAAREGAAAGPEIALKAPFRGQVAAVAVAAGATVAAGEALARLVATDLAWIEVEVSPAGARRIADEGVRALVLDDPESGPQRIEEGLRRVAIAPEVSPRTGTVTVLLEAPRAGGPAFGTTVEAQVLTAAEQEGIVVPASAVVDDGGVSVVYVQLSGERFARREVVVRERQGELVLVDRLASGQRLVTRGGDAIRRASLMASGDVQGHVH